MKIIVAGAGHGGLVCAAKLAKAGHSVTVIEAKAEGSLGHDWEDRFTFGILARALGIEESALPKKIWRYRGDCAFVSPAKRTKVIIHYRGENRQRIMWRAPILNMLVHNAVKSGVKFIYSTEITGPITENNAVVGVKTAKKDYRADLVVDSLGAMSALRMNLPDSFGIEKEPKNGDLFYAWRAYFNKSENENPDVPFEVYMYHNGERGLSWFCTNDDSCDVLIGRVFRLDKEKVDEQLDIFRSEHPWLGTKILHGGSFAVIPVRRPLTLMVADGYAAVGDSAFMTTPMNGMGIDLSLTAGSLLADTIISKKSAAAKDLWKYNRAFHICFGGDTAKNEGLKNAILSLPSKGVDFLFDNRVIESSDLAGAGRNTNLFSLIGKFKRGMRKPRYFIALLKGLSRGASASELYKNPPEEFDLRAIGKWSKKIAKNDIRL